MNILRSNWFRSLIAIMVSAAIFFFLSSRIDLENVKSAICQGNLTLVLLAAMISLLINVFFGAEKWRRILSDLGCPLSYREVLTIRSGCTPFKIIFPLKSSELLKAFYLKKQKKLSFGRALSSLLLDKTLNLLVTLGIFMVGLSLVDLRIPKMVPIVGLLGIVMILFSKKIRNWCINLSRLIHPKLHSFIKQLLSSFEDIAAGEKIILTLYSLLFQISEFITTYILLKAVGVTVPFSLILVLIPLIMVVNNFPVTVLGIGTREALNVFLFAAYGSSSVLMGAGVLVSVIEHIFPVLVGLLFIKPFITYFTLKENEIPQGE